MSNHRTSNDHHTIAIIPARGGSKGIPRKNVRFLQGRPLISYTIRTALKCRRIDRVIVSTDDDEISHISKITGAEVIRRPAHLAADDVPLDPVIHHAVKSIEQNENVRFDVVITLQPTSPLLSSRTLDEALARFFNRSADTLISVVDDRHLAWTKRDGEYVPLYKARVNRQYLPANFRETGGFVITKREHVTATGRFGAHIDLFETTHTEAVDIDGYMDWWLADKLLSRKRILFRVDGYEEIGLGHIYRTLMIASKLIDHEVMFLTQAQHHLGTRKIEESFYPCTAVEDQDAIERVITEFNPHIVINDILDTSERYIDDLKERDCFVVNFEDLGSGARKADVVVNALYEEARDERNLFNGKEYYCLRDEFLLLEPRPVSDTVQEVLVTFGGTDANNYTKRILEILNRTAGTRSLHITVVTGLGYAHTDTLVPLLTTLDVPPVTLKQDILNISEYMHRADLVFTSAGRTVFEVASLGTPLIVMAQNERELKHTFAREENGIVNLGLGYRVSDEEIARAFVELEGDFERRDRYHQIMLGHNLKRGMDNVLKLIFEKYEAWDREKVKR